jgi:hypothetical protein
MEQKTGLTPRISRAQLFCVSAACLSYAVMRPASLVAQAMHYSSHPFTSSAFRVSASMYTGASNVVGSTSNRASLTRASMQASHPPT